MAKPLTIGNDADYEIRVNEDRVLVRRKQKEEEDTDVSQRTAVMSHAVLNGGLQFFPAGASLQILNARVPANYDGVNPNPKEFMRQLAQKEHTDGDDESLKERTIGLQTAACMSSICVATQQATGQICRQTFVVDAIVTAGIGNARAAGADADFLSFSFSPPKDDSASQKDTHPKKFGTINAIIITNAILEESSTAMVEAYAVAIEAKCRAASDMGMICAKDPSETATGTGTDSTVIVCQQQTKQRGIEYSGKHSLFGELIGQAVYQATRGAIEKNLTDFYRDYHPISPFLCYRLRCYKLQLLQALQEGHRPRVPLDPMNPLPGPNKWVMMVGLLGVMLAFALHISTLQPMDHCRQSMMHLPKPSASVLLGYFWGDRFLGAVKIPFLAHPVVIMGNLISFLLSWIPDSCYKPGQAILGFLSGLVFFFTAVIMSVTSIWGVLLLPNLVSFYFQDLETCATNTGWSFYVRALVDWGLHVFVVGGALSLQLLCSIPLQMAHFLERNQLQQARNLLVWLCSRDPSKLKADELAGGTLESLSENLSDSIVGPLLYYILLGPVGAFAFRAMNTLDSNVGYRGRYEWVGKPSAKWDDLICLIPARLTAALLILAAVTLNVLAGIPNPVAIGKEALAVAWRDAGQCDSPNAGWPMATFAGILGVQLEKKGQYCLNGPEVGNGKPPGYRDIRKGHSVAQLAGVLSLLFAAVASGWVHAFK